MILTLIYGKNRPLRGQLVWEPLKFEMYAPDKDCKKDNPNASEVLLVYLKHDDRMENLVLFPGDELWLTGPEGNTVNHWSI
jgi:hypothetical protein